MHFRCIAHSLNLLATTDCRKAQKMTVYNRMYQQVFDKLQGLWNKYNQSPKFADKYKEYFPNLGLITPTATRWNSRYDSVKRILALYEKDSVAFTSVLAAANIRPFTPEHIPFLKEWVKVMKHVAIAMDYLQGDQGMFLGYLLPMIKYMKDQLEEAKKNVTVCKPLAEAALQGARNRFNAYFEHREMLVAAAYLPECKVDFLEEEQRELAKQFLIQAAIEETPEVTVSQEERPTKTGPFAKRPHKLDTAEMEVTRYLADESDDIKSVLQFKRIKGVFLRYNAILPSSASLETLFSAAKLVFRENRCRMMDEHFEKQLLFLANKSN